MNIKYWRTELEMCEKFHTDVAFDLVSAWIYLQLGSTKRTKVAHFKISHILLKDASTSPLGENFNIQCKYYMKRSVTHLLLY